MVVLIQEICLFHNKHHRHVILFFSVRSFRSRRVHLEDFNDDGHVKSKTNLAFKCFSVFPFTLELRQHAGTKTKVNFFDGFKF